MGSPAVQAFYNPGVGLENKFDVYKDIEPEKFTEVGEWSGREAAEAEVRRCRDRHDAREEKERR